MTEQNADVVTTQKVDPVKRGIAIVIDGVISGVLSAILTAAIPFLGWVIGAAYMLLRDALPIAALDFKSVGKKVMNLKVVVENDPEAKIDYATSAKRNWMFALGPFAAVPIVGWFIILPAAMILGIIEIVKVFTDPEGKRIGDGMAGTKVIAEQ